MCQLLLINHNESEFMYVKGNEACKQLGIHPNTLRKLADSGKIDTIRVGGQRRYDINKYLGGRPNAETVCYCRVSSPKQRDDLQRQTSFMQQAYPQAEIVKDIGSGLNFKRKGLLSILERSMSGANITLVVAHRDRLARFGYELIKYIIERNGGRLMVFSEPSLSPESELTEDLLNIIQVFSCRMHGLRNYKKQVSEIVSNQGAEKNI